MTRFLQFVAICLAGGVILMAITFFAPVGWYSWTMTSQERQLIDDEFLCQNGGAAEKISACTRVIASTDAVMATPSPLYDLYRATSELLIVHTKPKPDFEFCTNGKGTERYRVTPSGDTPYINRGRGYACSREYAKAIADFTTALRLNPHNATALALRGSAHEQAGSHVEAFMDYIAAETIDPTMTFAREGAHRTNVRPHI